MLSSSNTSTNSPIFYVDNISSYLIDESTNYSTSYYHSPSPLFYNNDIDNFGEFITNQELSIIQQSMLPNNNNNNDKDYNKSIIDHIITDDSSILERDTKVDSNKIGDDHESEIINGIVEDNGETNHIISNSTTTTTTTTNCHPIKKKRTSNKDRHSKIRTAQGLRDRRMRLSLQAAGQFFQLQDMLGYDKASTTVEWLLIQSKPAIDELFQSKHGSPPSGVTTTKCTTTSSNSDECEVESTKTEAREQEDNNNPKEKRVLSTIKEEPKLIKRRRTTKLERQVARERAKQRTLEKMQSRNNTITSNNSFISSSDYHHYQSLDFPQNAANYRS